MKNLYKEKIARINVAGIDFCCLEYSEVLQQIHRWHNNRKCGVISLVNPHSVITSLKDPDMDKALRQSSLVLPDGAGISLASWILGYPVIHRVTGPALMLKLCEWSQHYGYTHFFYGGAEGVAQRLANELSKKYPRLKVAGTYCPPFRAFSAQEDSRCIDYINSCKPDIVWIGLGAPKQEKWMNQHLGQIRAAAVIGIGAAFDFHSGQKKWAPQWIRALGIEWAYRLLQEPKRMWRRNLNSFVFLYYIFAQKLKLWHCKSKFVSCDNDLFQTSELVYDWPEESQGTGRKTEEKNTVVCPGGVL